MHVCILVGSETEGYFDLGFLRKKNTHAVVKFCAQKSVGIQVHKKVFSNLVNNLSKWIEG